MKKLFGFISNTVIPFGTLFLIFFIPVYPKLPIIDIFGTWVYIRLEDFLVAILIGLFLLVCWKNKKFSDSKLTFPILFYWIIGGISVLNSIFFIGSHLANYLPHLAMLHFLRRIEYMMLFFIAYDVYSKKKDLIKPIIWIIAAVMVCIITYGIGQKFAGFPAFLTMNEEFAKGVPLRLPPTARIVSTFGGHYDLAAYLVLIIPIIGSLIFGLEKLWQKLFFFCLTLGSVVLLLFTASRVSFGVYLVSISAMLFWQKKKILIVPVIIVSIILLNLVSGASERFYKTFRYQDVIVDLSTGKPIGTLDKLEGASAVVEKIASPAVENLPKGSGYISIPQVSEEKSNKPVTRIIFSKDLATGSGEVATLSGSFLIQKALIYDISITTRFQGQWPRAIAAFQRNMLLGSGYSTLSVAVDGNYHRMIGETGILGTVAFLGILALSFFLFIKGRNELLPLQKAFVSGFFAGLIGLLLNAVLIDVFEASKVAFSFWILMGISMAVLSKTVWTKSYFSFLQSLLTGNVAMTTYVAIGVFVLYRTALSGYFLGDDFTWLRWAAESSWVDIANSFSNSAGFFYRPISKLWYFVLYSIFWLKSDMYHVITVSLYSILCILLYQNLFSLKIGKVISLFATLFFANLTIHHENVFWISGHSSLLGAIFLLAAIKSSFVTQDQHLVWKKHLFIYITWFLTFLSMLSYDSLVVAPLILFTIQFFVHRQRNKNIYFVLLLLPIYWIMRAYANAVVPSGDYGYKPSTFLINSIVNTFVYTVSTFIGPRVIEFITNARIIFREFLAPITGVVLFSGLLSLMFIKNLSSYISRNSAVFVWLLCGFISLIPFLGLGGAAERYALVPSVFLILFLASATTLWVNKGTVWLRWGIVIIIYFLLFYWNRLELSKISKEWQFANDISNETLLKIKHEYFPFGDRKTFIFIDTPIRYGRAWIFPTGLPDALWHMFRQAPFTVLQMSNIEEAVSHQTVNGTTVVHRFENYNLKKVEVQLIDISENE